MALDLNGQWAKTTEKLKELKAKISEADGYDKPGYEIVYLVLENQLVIIEKLREKR